MEARSFAWRCPRCNAIRIDYIRDGALSHIIAKGGGNEHIALRAYGLILLHLRRPLYAPAKTGEGANSVAQPDTEHSSSPLEGEEVADGRR